MQIRNPAARRALSLPYCQKEENLLRADEMRGLPRHAFHLHQLFREGGEGMHVLRAPDPSLRQRYRRVDCPAYWPPEVIGGGILKTGPICSGITSLFSSRKRFKLLYAKNRI
jgi:hypothetical protein